MFSRNQFKNWENSRETRALACPAQKAVASYELLSDVLQVAIKRVAEGQRQVIRLPETLSMSSSQSDADGEKKPLERNMQIATLEAAALQHYLSHHFGMQWQLCDQANQAASEVESLQKRRHLPKANGTMR